MYKAFMHLFHMNDKYYVYDVNTKVVLNISKNIYIFLNNENEEVLTDDEKNYFNCLKNEGFFLNKYVIETEHPETKKLPYYIKYNMSYLILQVTQNCNLRCDYCVYSGGYKTRGHSQKKMSFSLAKKGIDYLIEHSTNSQNLVLGFYGGEPLLEISLIKKCVEYIEARVEDKDIWYSITTNATLLRLDVIDVLVKHNCKITLSIDGPQSLHDKNRKYAGSDEGSFNNIIENLKLFVEKYPIYFENNITVNTVLDASRGFKIISDFFKSNEIFEKINIRASLISDDYSGKEHIVCEQYKIESRYEEFILYLAALNRIDKKFVSPLLRNSLADISRLKLGTRYCHRDMIEEKSHHGGPCVPGGDRLFLTTDGTLYPCEKVCELSELAKLGNIYEGINLIYAEKMLNIEKLTASKCHHCWAYDFCDVCIRLADNNESNLAKNIACQCIKTKRELEETIKDYIFLKEQGYDFETMEYIKRS